MPDRPRVSAAPDGSPSPLVVSSALADLQQQLADERAAHDCERVARRKAEEARRAAEAARRTAEARAARLEAENAQSAEQIGRLEHLVEEFRRALFGKKSEKLGADDRQLSFDDLGTAIAEAGGQAEPSERALTEKPGPGSGVAAGGRAARCASRHILSASRR